MSTVYLLQLRLFGEWTNFDVFSESQEAMEMRLILIKHGESAENIRILREVI